MKEFETIMRIFKLRIASPGFNQRVTDEQARFHENWETDKVLDDPNTE